MHRKLFEEIWCLRCGFRGTPGTNPTVSPGMFSAAGEVVVILNYTCKDIPTENYGHRSDGHF